MKIEWYTLQEGEVPSLNLSKEQIKDWYWNNPGNNIKRQAVDICAKLFDDIGATNIVSVGSGFGILEYELSLKGFSILPTDICPKRVEVLNYMHDGKAQQWDMKSDFKQLFDKHKPDTVIFFSSLPVLSDGGIIKLFSEIRDAGVKNILDIQFNNYVDFRKAIRYWISQNIRVRWYKFLRHFGRRMRKAKWPGVFCGWTRTRSRWEVFYETTGWDIEKKFPIGTLLKQSDAYK